MFNLFGEYGFLRHNELIHSPVATISVWLQTSLSSIIVADFLLLYSHSQYNCQGSLLKPKSEHYSLPKNGQDLAILCQVEPKFLHWPVHSGTPLLPTLPPTTLGVLASLLSLEHITHRAQAYLRVLALAALSFPKCSGLMPKQVHSSLPHPFQNSA